jgi:hypothetical protein
MTYRETEKPAQHSLETGSSARLFSWIFFPRPLDANADTEPVGARKLNIKSAPLGSLPRKACCVNCLGV